MLFERVNECGKDGKHRGAAADRGDVPELSRFGEEGACYFDFAGLIGGIIDVVLCSDGPRINGSEGQVFASEDGGLVKLGVGHSERRYRKDGIGWAIRGCRFWA